MMVPDCGSELFDRQNFRSLEFCRSRASHVMQNFQSITVYRCRMTSCNQGPNEVPYSCYISKDTFKLSTISQLRQKPSSSTNDSNPSSCSTLKRSDKRSRRAVMFPRTLTLKFIQNGLSQHFTQLHTLLIKRI